MALAFKGRWESRFTIPSGGASVSAQVANGGSAATVTVPSAAYYLTAAGGISGLVATLQSKLESTSALHGFPRTATVMDTVVGGDWTNGSGWLCQEASGNLAPVFGAVTLTASGTPTYQNAGIKDGDYAVGFSTTNDALSGGDVHDIGVTDDLIIAWVGKFTGTPAASRDLFNKRTGVQPRYIVYFNSSTGALTLNVNDGTDNLDTSVTSALHVGEWHVGLAVVERATNQTGIGTRSLSGTSAVSSAGNAAAIGTLENSGNLVIGNATLGASTDFQLSAFYIVTGSGVATGLVSGLSTALTNFANAINSRWSVSLSDTTGQVTINWSGYETPTHSLSWTSTTLRDVLGFDEHISNATSATTGAAQSPACWLPDAPLNVDGHPAMTPEETDLRVTESPTGVTLGLAGNTKYVHTNVRYRRVPVDRIREADAAVDNASLEVFLRNTQFGQGDISWFTPASPCQIYWNNAGTLTLLSNDANSGTGVEGWTIVGVSSFAQAVRLSQDGYTGHFDVTFPRLVSSG